MICPECESEMELTWRRYISAPFGRYRCSNCSAKFKFRNPLWFSLLLPIAQVVFLLLGGYVIIFYMAGDPVLGVYAKPAVIVLVLTSIIFFCIIDKGVKNQIGRTKV